MANKDQAAGKAKEIKGSIREGLGKATSNEQQVAKGKVEKTEGRVQGKVGQVKHEVNKKI
jgi:uncharacterized protein YjbJ (UPF0337 family)